MTFNFKDGKYNPIAANSKIYSIKKVPNFRDLFLNELQTD